jgi:hypothetical protein
LILADQSQSTPGWARAREAVMPYQSVTARSAATYAGGWRLRLLSVTGFHQPPSSAGRVCGCRLIAWRGQGLVPWLLTLDPVRGRSGQCRSQAGTYIYAGRPAITVPVQRDAAALRRTRGRLGMAGRLGVRQLGARDKVYLACDQVSMGSVGGDRHACSALT